MMDTETPDATREDRLLYLRAFRAVIRYRDEQTGRRHFCHLMPYRPHTSFGGCWSFDVRCRKKGIDHAGEGSSVS